MTVKVLRHENPVVIAEDRMESNCVSAVIQDSWQRCIEMGVDPEQKIVKKVYDKTKFKELLEENAQFIEVAIPFMENIYNFVAGSGFIVTLTDRNGIILKIIGDEDVLQRFRNGNFREGADWSERSAGTNAIGTSLAINKPIQIFAHEHFCRCSQYSACSSAPIHDPEGNVLGVLDMTGDDHNVHSHTLGMVVAAAHAITNALAIISAEKRCQLSNRYQSTIINSISEALLATDMKGHITQLNAQARKILNLPPDDLLGRDIFDVLPGNNEDLFTIITTGKYVTDTEIAINTPKGRLKYTVTSRPIHKCSVTIDGIVLILNEIKRAKKIAQRLAGASAVFTFDNLIGRDKSFLKSVETGKIAASGESNILLLGESGTGKDVFAQSIHNESDRKNGPFVAINCAAIPRELIGSELFGYVEGAFTGAKRGGSLGKFELADGGTIFLDEIGEMPLELQATLLRVIEQKKLFRIGGQDVIPVDVRIIAATNQDLQDRVQQKLFRQDLYYRLNVMSIRMIPLRQRIDDIPLLVNYFYHRFIKKLGKQFYPIPKEYIEYLYNHSWPGNVRELQNVIERGVNLSRTGKLDVSLLPDEILNINSRMSGIPQTDVIQTNTNLEDVEREVIFKLMQEHEGNISKVANQLGIARSTLYRKLNKLGIKKEISM